MPNILEELEAMLARDPELEASHYGVRIANDTSLLSTFRNGRKPRKKMVGKIRDFITARTAELAQGEDTSNGSENRQNQATQAGPGGEPGHQEGRRGNQQLPQ